MIRVGVLGYGSRIRGVLNNIVKESQGNVKVVAFYDNSEGAVKRATDADPDIQVCSSVDELVNLETLDWIFVGSFNAEHHGHAVPAIKSGKHVFCEKPVATTKQHCLDMIAARQAHPDASFGVGFVLRYSAFYRTMKQWIDEGRLGRLISMELNETLSPAHGASMHGNWRRKREFGGPMVLEKCCHDIDLMLWMTGSRPARVASFGGLDFFTPENAHHNDDYPANEDGVKLYGRGLASGWAVGQEKNVDPFTDDKDTIDNQVAIMELENGARLSFHYCMHSAQPERRFYMCGTKGTIRGDVLTGTLEYTPVGWEPETEVVKPIDGDGHGGAEMPMTLDALECMLNGTPMPTTLEDGVEASFVCLGLDEACKAGTVVDMQGYWDSLGR